MIVLDSSFFLAKVFRDEEDARVLKLFEAIELADMCAFVPGIFFYEIHNSLVTAVKRKRIHKSQVPVYLKLFALAPVTVAEKGSSNEIMEIALSHGLSFYDASYFELAKRRKIPLATLDKKLHDAAAKEILVFQ